MDFLLKYYLYFVGVLVIFVLGLIGYLVDSYKTEKYRKPKIKKEIKKDVPKIKETTNEIIENLNLEEIGNKTISSLQKDNQNVSSNMQKASNVAPNDNIENMVIEGQQQVSVPPQNPNNGV